MRIHRALNTVIPFKLWDISAFTVQHYTVPDCYHFIIVDKAVKTSVSLYISYLCGAYLEYIV